MGGSVVLFHRDGSPVDRGAAPVMLDALDHCGPDGSRLLVLPSVAIGHQHFWTTPEEVGEQQPLSSSDGRYHLAFDGRIDNRTELLAALDEGVPVSSDGEDHISDAALVLAAFQRWGEGCFERLLGPFAVIIADQLENRLVCARDPLGDRTLCYHLSHRIGVVATREEAILCHPGLDRRLDEQSLAAYYAVQAPPPGATMFRQVQEILPGHCLVVDRSSQRSRCFWTPPLQRLHYRRDQEYCEHFLELLDRAVGARLRAISTPAVLMSGGLDSTSVAALAARRLAAGERLTTISWIFDELPNIDERRYIDAMVETYRLRSLQLVCDDAWPLQDSSGIPANPSRPELSPHRLLAERAFTATREAGATVLLSGWFDHIYSGGGSWLVELARDSRLGLAAGELVRLVASHGLRSSRHPFLRATARQLLGRLPSQAKLGWLTTQARSTVHKLEDWPPRTMRAARPQQQRSVLGLLPALTASAERFHANRAGVEQRYPYRDRRLVELMLTLPAYQLYRSGIRKYILVQAMHGILPEPVRLRTEPTSLTPLYVRGVHEREEARVRELLGRPDALWRQYVRADWLQQEIELRRAHSLVLWLCLSMELWRKETDVQQ